MSILINKIFRTAKYVLKTTRFYSNRTVVELKPPWKVLFFGSDDFSLASLKLLLKAYEKETLLSKLEVVTSAKENAVRKYATQNKLFIHNWPHLEKVDKFHLGVVVSFGHLIPEAVINMFPMGMLNVHASLLPRWRGAAPIIYALANGDERTGVSIMRIRPKKFDCGEILLQDAIDVPKDMRMPELYAKLACLGADTLVAALTKLPGILDNCRQQPEKGMTLAPRVTAKIAVVDWKQLSALEVYNLSRAVAGLFNISSQWNGTVVKLHNIKENERTNSEIVDIKPGRVKYDKLNKLVLVQCCDGTWISCDKIGINKKVMSAVDFNNGYIKKLSLEKRLFASE